MQEIECAHWEWYGLEVEGDEVWYIMYDAMSLKHYMLSDITSDGIRIWTTKFHEALTFSSELETDKFIKKYLPDEKVIKRFEAFQTMT